MSMSYRRRVGAEEELAELAVPFMDNLGDGILARAQRLVPKETWSLHDSLAKVTERTGAVVTTSVGVDPDFVGTKGRKPIDYWLFVEKGTSKMAPEPYLLPALLQTHGITVGSGE